MTNNQINILEELYKTLTLSTLNYLECEQVLEQLVIKYNQIPLINIKNGQEYTKNLMLINLTKNNFN